jgi:hypothetical protein
VRSEFRGYYRPTEEEFKVLWRTADVVVDANVLLNLYRYSIDTRRGLLEILEQVADRLWLPHQAALEYQRTRIEVMSQERQAYGKIVEVIDRSRSSVVEAFRQRSRHLVLDFGEASALVEAKFAEMIEYVAAKEKIHPDLPEGVAPGDEDEVRDKLTTLFEGRVGPAFSDERLAEICAEGLARYAQAVPPGYRDADKPEDRRYGDLVIWNKFWIAQARPSGRCSWSQMRKRMIGGSKFAVKWYCHDPN